ncbi:MAG: STAS domain-containing protein [Pseudomonadota bacterium]|nr:MAG: STAS domain-containing protein [Pseudomonadota bacterium]
MVQNDACLKQGGDGELLLTGALSFASVPQLEGLLEPLQRPGKETVIDLRGVKRSDSAGLALLVEWLRQTRQRGAKLTFRNIPEQMQAMARISQVYGLLNDEAPDAD